MAINSGYGAGGHSQHRSRGGALGWGPLVLGVSTLSPTPQGTAEGMGNMQALPRRNSRIAPAVWYSCSIKSVQGSRGGTARSADVPLPHTSISPLAGLGTPGSACWPTPGWGKGHNPDLQTETSGTI